MKTWYELIIINWSQITVILGVIGYIVTTLVNWNLRKTEISFTKVQEQKILEIKEFYKSYQKLEYSLYTFLNQTNFGSHEPEILNDIRKQIQEYTMAFEYNCMCLKLFIQESQITTIEEIYNSCCTIRKDIDSWHIYKTGINPEKYTEYNEKLNNIGNTQLPELSQLLKRIESSLRKDYNIK
jgi:hypothetical protein